jgi:putative ABC transport system permease protein
MTFQLGENTRMAFNTLREHKVRSVLSVVGVVVGITAVITVSSILVGIDQDVRAMLDDFGPETLFIRKFTPGFSHRTAEERMRKSPNLEDALAMKEICPAVKDVSAQVFPGPGQGQLNIARRGTNEVIGPSYFGAIPSFERVMNANIDKGRFFTDGEDLQRAHVTVIGAEIAKALFPSEDPLGGSFAVNGIEYRVVGVMHKRKGNFLRGDGGDREVIIPYRTYKKHFPRHEEHFIAVQPYPGMKAAAEDQVRGLLRQRRRVPFDQPDNFGISSAEQIAGQFRDIMGGIALLIFTISSVGLLVGGVGVMNIMLMSVTERTREIGVRKALGARKRDVISQFLTEAVAITSVGGVIGILLGSGFALLIRLVIPAAVPLWAVLTALTICMGLGIFFGMYPAVKAARLDPVDALRYE